ncbi:hypothetical protein BDK51DRAFT_49372 [Blyttiomyces helicus]|uniref:Uncharacterized protein n=1 Tax=Blyttiomyces helicus TaxID=388810 RepID=A0A4P9VZG5_9FUNG|nr:hypothetical protein BDK51DRAFT_49372 [Blyttiomyces helicus]|eukprot:RKO84183.1 hypothetical protein BDK51DRAFT_49372 [Blyttiomyces helicus]
MPYMKMRRSDMTLRLAAMEARAGDLTKNIASIQHALRNPEIERVRNLEGQQHLQSPSPYYQTPNQPYGFQDSQQSQPLPCFTSHPYPYAAALPSLQHGYQPNASPYSATQPEVAFLPTAATTASPIAAPVAPPGQQQQQPTPQYAATPWGPFYALQPQTPPYSAPSAAPQLATFFMGAEATVSPAATSATPPEHQQAPQYASAPHRLQVAVAAAPLHPATQEAQQLPNAASYGSEQEVQLTPGISGKAHCR